MKQFIRKFPDRFINAHNETIHWKAIPLLLKLKAKVMRYINNKDILNSSVIERASTLGVA